MENYIDCKKKLYNTIIEFLEVSNETNQQCFTKFCENMRNFHFEGDREEMTQFLSIIKSISNHHLRSGDFIEKIKEIIIQYKDQIKQTLSNDEIFHIFESNKLIVLFLLKNDIISISEGIYNEMINKIELNGNRYSHFFYPELEKFKGKEEMKYFEEELLSHNPTAFDHFEEKRQEGQNDSYICSLIRTDSITEFISYINLHNISVSSEISPSIFETNSFLIDNNSTTLIEYSAFFGSIQIFKYLHMNKVELTSSLWLYSIHSRNAELINFLESNKVNPPEFMDNSGYLSCLIESIKCHHNDFSEYIENNYMNEQYIKSTKAKEEIISNSMKYHNYSYLQASQIKEQGFFYSHLYNYNKFVDFILKDKEKEIEEKIIFL